MSETRKLAAILVADVVGYSRFAGTDGERTSRGSGASQPVQLSGMGAVHRHAILQSTA